MVTPMKKRGFTLIELLVVISIIALLMAILVPSLQVARRMARIAVCANNMKNLMSCEANYAGEWSGFAAPQGDRRGGTWSASESPWFHVPLQVYMGGVSYGTPTDATYVPSMFWVFQDGNPLGPESQKYMDRQKNLMYYANSGCPNWGFGGYFPTYHSAYRFNIRFDSTSGTTRMDEPIKFVAGKSTLKSFSAIPFFSEDMLQDVGTKNTDTLITDPTAGIGLTAATWYRQGYTSYTTGGVTTRYYNVRHDATGMNVAFADHHVKFATFSRTGGTVGMFTVP